MLDRSFEYISYVILLLIGLIVSVIPAMAIITAVVILTISSFAAELYYRHFRPKN